MDIQTIAVISAGVVLAALGVLVVSFRIYAKKIVQDRQTRTELKLQAEETIARWNKLGYEGELTYRIYTLDREIRCYYTLAFPATKKYRDFDYNEIMALIRYLEAGEQ